MRTFEATDADAVVCTRGVYRAGCAGPNAAVVVRKPVPVVRCTRVLGERRLREALRLTPGGQCGAVWLWFVPEDFGHAQSAGPKASFGVSALSIIPLAPDVGAH
ncbi:hypothetical protein [Bradyrhizobium sp. DASA03120]|uniref:hypothetical protein n=1 Tax=Bradyrhizobium sp. SMVTL-02 TaxID=3395917 RepID=UPI003F6F175E